MHYLGSFRGVTKRYPIEDALGRAQEASDLSEPDVLRLFVVCSLPAAQSFERFVFEKILPAIRKTGSYSAPAALSFIIRTTMAGALRLAAEQAE